MPDDRDRRLAQLAVEGGFLTREEAVSYWQRIQAPGSPRLVQLLVQDGRLSPADLEQLRSRFYASQQGGAVATAPPPPAPSPPSPPSGPSSSGEWESDLRKDALLARVLLGNGACTQEQLRECRQLQLQHHMRLGVVLVKKGYADRGMVEAAISMVRQQLGDVNGIETTRDTGRFGPSAGGTSRFSGDNTERMAGQGPPLTIEPPPGPPGSPPGGPGNAPLSDPFASVRGASPLAPQRGLGPPAHNQVATILDNAVLPTPGPPPPGFRRQQDQVPTVLNQPAVRPSSGGTDRMRPDEEQKPHREDRFDVSMEELNPFGDMGPSGPLPSIEELNPFVNQPSNQPATKRMPQGIAALQSGGFDDDMPLPSAPEAQPDPFAPPSSAGPPSGGAPPISDPFAQADFNDPDPFASSKKVTGPPDPFGSQGPPSGLTPAGVPVGGVADSDSVKKKAKKVKKKTVSKKNNTSTLLLVLIVASILLVVLLVVLLQSIL